MLDKSSIKFWKLNFLSKKLIHAKQKVCLRFRLFKIFKAVPKNKSNVALTSTK